MQHFCQARAQRGASATQCERNAARALVAMELASPVASIDERRNKQHLLQRKKNEKGQKKQAEILRKKKYEPPVVEGNLDHRFESDPLCLEVFSISKVGNIAGCFVKEGIISRNSKIRILRDNLVVHTGEISSLKRFKEEVKEVKTGYECGVMIENYSDIKVNDIIETFEVVETSRKL